jgi:integrase/recombinase XerD
VGEIFPVSAAYPAPTVGHAAEAFLVAHIVPAAWSPGTAVKYRQTLTILAARLGEFAPATAANVAGLGTAAGARALAGAFGDLAPATRARHLSTVRSALAWWRGVGWLAGDPTAGWARPKVPVDATRALTRDQVAALWRLDVPLRDKTLWRLLYETVGRAEEILGLDAGDLELPGKRARVISKGGMTEWVHWQTGAALLLAGRRRGPVFLASRKPARAVATADLCPVTGQARLSYRRAAELFELSTRPLAHPDAHGAELAGPHGWNLHQLRHSMLTQYRERDQHAHPARPLPARLRPLPRALRPARPRSRRPSRRRHRPRRTAPAASQHGHLQLTTRPAIDRCLRWKSGKPTRGRGCRRRRLGGTVRADISGFSALTGCSCSR